MSNDNMNLWDSVYTTDPAHTKKFQKKGGLKGTTAAPMYLIRKATALWGPMGEKWGVRIVSEHCVDGAPLFHETLGLVGREVLHVVQIELIHPTGTVPAFGQTILAGKDKNGFFTDEDAPKKSLTDALTKALSWLGFSADIYMGLYDDAKYVEAVRKEIAEKKAGDAGKTLKEETMKTLNEAAEQGIVALRAVYRTLSDEAKEICSSENANLKARADAADARKENQNAGIA
jgi:hypothetical protein